MSPAPQRSVSALAAAAATLAAVSTAGLFVALFAAGCNEPREEATPGPTWAEDVGPLFQARCVGCHAGDTPDGSYALDTYPGALGGGPDGLPDAVAGDPESVLVTRLAQADHLAYLSDDASEATEALDLVSRWVVDERLAYFHSVVHPPSFVNPAEPDFHGREIQAAGWSTAKCRSCHGNNYAGGDAQVSCLSCHPRTPEACDTCHGKGPTGVPPPSLGAPEAIGAHVVHLAGSVIARPVACEQCHVVPERLSSAGHTDADGRAELTFGSIASSRGATPTYDFATRSCSEVACHGAGLEGGTTPAPEWNAGPAAAECGTCHGLPPTLLATGKPHTESARCELCHAGVGPELTITNPQLHVNGAVDLLPAVLECNGCHSSPQAPLPFRDTLGRTDATLRTVGAHERHLKPGFFTNGFTCDKCHKVPVTLGDAGHVDASPAELVFATGTGLDDATLTCNAGCHGADLEGGPEASPVWNAPQHGLVCGSCHALPPIGLMRNGEVHPPAAECGSCHPAVIDDHFNWVDKSLHANGVVEWVTP